MENKIINLQKYKFQKQLKEQIDILDTLHEHFTFNEPDPILRKGYENFRKLMKGIDKKYDTPNKNTD